MENSFMPSLYRRDFLRYGSILGAATAATASGVISPGLASWAQAATMRRPGSLPDPHRPAGAVDESLPFDHIVVVMMENHSFDNYLGMLPAAGSRLADGFKINARGVPINSNPTSSGPVRVHPFPNTAQGPDVGQNWNATHRQIHGGKMDGFVYGNNGATQAMGYYPPEVLPFAYSFASTFTVGNRWFCSAPCQTYPTVGS